MNQTLLHHYRRYRRHQMQIAADGGGMLTTYRNGRTELSYASAPYGEHAAAALAAARAHIAFMRREGFRG